MIGNDVVDLHSASLDSPDSSKNARRYKRFLDKIFSIKEQEIIKVSKDGHQTIWLLWSMKEAAYKIYVQQFKKPFYNPKRIECQLLLSSEGLVKIENTSYKTRSKISKDCIYTTASSMESRVLKSKFFQCKIGDAVVTSEFIKNKLIKHVSKASQLPISAFSIKTFDLGIPKLYLNNSKTNDSISFTHHGRFSGYAISS
ncbi:4'-phosphopantetheinyl transferase superfamily protein [Changchengzhania lutea]|uniref:4'-phosphopantetheinyl transferase superfamily protein n=1 Tax=Changchengzhania lutea TaxID=2049305 RepID=UPI00115DA9DD|nr:4'-phosphopantetheinyl transferase superfamily protein [Changchengzhania lutea]